MNWRITYRAKNGRQTVDVFEAETRNALFKALAAKGISAIRVEEANGKESPRKDKKPSMALGAAAAVILILAIAGIMFIVHGDKTKPEKEAKPCSPKITAAKPSLLPTVAKPKDAGSSNNDTVSTKDDVLPPHKRIVEMISVVTNADGSVLERFRTADGKTRSRQSAPKPVFDNASDQLLAAAISGAESGAAMPPMPMMNNADEEFRMSLEKEITINDDDSDTVKALKQSVIALRNEMRQLLDEGHSFAEVLRDHREVVNHGVEMRKEATRLIKEFMDEGDGDAARSCLEKVNDTLTQMGIEGVEMPLSREERRETIRQQHKAMQ